MVHQCLCRSPSPFSFIFIERLLRERVNWILQKVLALASPAGSAVSSIPDTPPSHSLLVSQYCSPPARWSRSSPARADVITGRPRHKAAAESGDQRYIRVRRDKQSVKREGELEIRFQTFPPAVRQHALTTLTSQQPHHARYTYQLSIVSLIACTNN